jgi:HSP20 family protein
MLTRWIPFEEFDSMERRMRRMLAQTGIVPTFPSTDLYETDGEYVVELEAPGFDEKELTIELSDHTLMIKGERAETKEKEQKTFYFKERLEKSFERRFTLPTEADTKHLTASFKKGVLEIHAPKVQVSKPMKVAIEAK